MLLMNLNQRMGLCNGTRLIVNELFDHVIETQIITENAIAEKVYIRRIKMIIVNETRDFHFVFCRKQFPVRLSYAMTMNKSQGQTLNMVGLYLPRPIFTHGQLYVAISRITSKSGLKILMHDTDNTKKDCTDNIVYKEILHCLH